MIILNKRTTIFCRKPSIFLKARQQQVTTGPIRQMLEEVFGSGIFGPWTTCAMYNMGEAPQTATPSHPHMALTTHQSEKRVSKFHIFTLKPVPIPSTTSHFDISNGPCDFLLWMPLARVAPFLCPDEAFQSPPPRETRSRNGPVTADRYSTGTWYATLCKPAASTARPPKCAGVSQKTPCEYFREAQAVPEGVASTPGNLLPYEDVTEIPRRPVVGCLTGLVDAQKVK